MDGEQDSLTLPLFNDILKQDEFYDSGDSLVTQGFQGRIDFRCQGQRRNETKTDKMGVVYGEDNRLCWRVIDPMPRAIVSTSTTCSICTCSTCSTCMHKILSGCIHFGFLSIHSSNLHLLSIHFFSINPLFTTHASILLFHPSVFLYVHPFFFYHSLFFLDDSSRYLSTFISRRNNIFDNKNYQL